jgi:hypothetical protein
MTKPAPDDRDAPGVVHAFAVGMVGCEGCGGVHIDFVDEGMHVVATGFLSYAQFMMVTDEVVDHIDLLQRGVAG